MRKEATVKKYDLSEILDLLEQFRDAAMSGYHATDVALMAASGRVDEIIKEARK